MARKVGFEKPDTEPAKSIADRYLDEFRAKAKSETARPPAPKPKRRRNWILILFMSIWITAWTFAILMAIGMLFSGGPVVFMVVWLTLACIGWIVALVILIRNIRGIPVQEKDVPK